MCMYTVIPLFSPVVTIVILCGYLSSNYFVIKRKYSDKRRWGMQCACYPHLIIEN